VTLVPESGKFPTDEFSRVVLEASGLLTPLRAIAVRITNPPQLNETESVCALKILDLEWEAPRWREITVELTDNATEDGAHVYAPNTLARVGTDRPRLETLDVSSDELALAAARWLVQEQIQRFRLAQFSLRKYYGPIAYGDTVEVCNYGFTGVVFGYHCSFTAGGQYSAELTLVDLQGGED